MEEEEIENEEQDLFEVIEELTTTGLADLDEDYMKKLKTRCKHSNEVLEESYHELLKQLGKQHAEIRYSSFQVMSELFSQSHYFRELVTRDLPRIFVFTVETEPHKHPLPLPLKVGKKLKLFTLKVFFQWYKKYAKSYRRIALAYEFLRDIKKVNFSVLERKVIEEKNIEDELKEKEEKRRKNKLEQIDIQIYDRFNDFKKNIDVIENCFDLILPKVEESGACKEMSKENDDNYGDDSDTEEAISTNPETGFIGSETGIHNKNYSVTIEFSSQLEIIEDETNTDIIKRLDELNDEIEQQNIFAKKWMRTLVKYKETDQDKIEKVRDLNKSFASVRSKYLKMKINRIPGTRDSDDEFIDVPEKEPVKIDVTDKDKTKENKGKASNKRKLPKSTSTTTSKTSSPVTKSKINSPNDAQTLPEVAKDNPSTTPYGKNDPDETEERRKEKLMKVAPLIPYGVDLEYWGKEIKPVASIKLDSQHRFWKTNEHIEEFVPPQLEAAMRMRVMSFPSKFEPVERKCGARMPSGRLCERMDRLKCPFHGKIVDRDERGKPLDTDQQEEEEEERELDGAKVEEEPRSSADNKSKKNYTPTGMTSYVNQKRQKKPKKKEIETPEERRKAREKARYARLSDINTKESGVVNRLEKKVFNKRAMNRVSQNLDANIKKKHMGKFGQQFNYLCG